MMARTLLGATGAAVLIFAAALVLPIVCCGGGSVGPMPVTGNLPTQAQGYATAGQGYVTCTAATNTVNLSQSPGLVVVTGTGTLARKGTGSLWTSTAIAGTYSLSTGTWGTLNNGNPVYQISGTTGFTLWNSTAGNWRLTNSSTRFNEGALGFSGSLSGPITTQTLGTLTGQGTPGCTLTPSATQTASAASVPCSRLILSCTSAGVLVGTGTAAGTWPLPANVPTPIPVVDVNRLWVTGSTQTVGYLWFGP